MTLQVLTTNVELFNYKYIAENYKTQGNVFEVDATVHLRKTKKIEKNYLHSFAVWVGGVHVANLSTDCRLPGQESSIKLQITNQVFYTLPGWLHYVRIIEHHMPLCFKSVSYLEIAYDFQASSPLLPALCWVYRYSSFIEKNTEIKFGPIDGRLKCSLQYGKEYTFGGGAKKSNGTGKQIAVYDKSAQIAETGTKEYISECYRKNGFDMSIPVERIETRLGEKYLGKIFITLDGLNNAEKLGQIFKAAVGNTFVFREVTKSFYDANRNKKTPTVTLIEFPELSSAPLYLLPVGDNMKENNDHSNRITAKTILHQYVAFGSEQDLQQLQHFAQTVKAPRNTTWAQLFNRYAQAYEGSPTPDRNARIDRFS